MGKALAFPRVFLPHPAPSKEGVLVQFPAKGTHFLDVVIAAEKQARSEQVLSRESRKTFMRFALKELLAHNDRQFAVLLATVVDGIPIDVVARQTNQQPVAIHGYRRRALTNLHTIYKKAEGAVRG